MACAHSANQARALTNQVSLPVGVTFGGICNALMIVDCPKVIVRDWGHG